MPISFNTIPAGSGLLVPGFYAEFDASRAGYGAAVKRALLIGQTNSAVSAVATFVTTADYAASLFGRGSVAHRMVEAYRLNDPVGELYVLPVAASGSGVAATGTIAVTGTATEARTLALYIAGQLVPVTVTSGMTATQAATAIAAAINAATNLPVTATSSTGTVTATARGVGTLGNGIDIRLNYLGARGGEVTPAGLAFVITAMASGATDATPADLDAVLVDQEFDFIGCAWSSAAWLNALDTLLSDSTGRWSYLRGIYGHAFAANHDSVANLLVLGATRNKPHVTVVGAYDSPTPAWERAAAWAAAVAVAVRADPARPLQTLALAGLKAPPVASRFSFSSRNSLLGTGIALESYDADGTARILRAVTTYQTNAGGQVDRSMLDAETLFTGAEVIRRLRSIHTTKFPRHKLAADGTRFGAGQPVITPMGYKAELVAAYAEMEADGLVQDVDSFIANTFCEIDASDPSRLNVLFAPVYIGGLRVLAILNQFRLQAA